MHGDIALTPGWSEIEPGCWRCDLCGLTLRNVVHPIRHACPKEPKGGPGAELKSLLASLGIRTTNGCKCNVRARQMDLWGVVGCREHFDEIAKWLCEAAEETTLGRWAPQWSKRAAAEWLVNEAIRRAER